MKAFYKVEIFIGKCSGRSGKLTFVKIYLHGLQLAMQAKAQVKRLIWLELIFQIPSGFDARSLIEAKQLGIQSHISR